AHLVEEVVDLLTVHSHLVGQWDRTGVVNDVVELVNQNQNVHCEVVSLRVCGVFSEAVVISGRLLQAVAHRDASWVVVAYPPLRRSARALATPGGTRSETSPPKVAISFTPVEERKL